MTERRYEFLRPRQYLDLRDAAPIAYLPWGAHEWHGLHNPLGTDSIKAHRIALELAERAGGVVFPPVYCGYHTMQRHGQKCTLEFPVELVEQVARHYFLQLIAEKFRAIVVIMGHYGRGHQYAIKRQAREIGEDWANCVRIIVEPDYEWTQPELPGDHGGANETSYMLEFYPETVDVSQLPALEEMPELDFARDGVGGLDPRKEASADRGRRQLELLLSRAVPRIASALDEIR